MPIWAIADLHLSFGVPNKQMDIFGAHWLNHPEKIEKGWRATVSEDDLILIPGDISWAMHADEAKIDLDWIGNLPGTKVLLKGNHDYWWESLSKIQRILPPSCHVIHNNSYTWNDVTIAGSRLWDSPEFNFDDIPERPNIGQLKNPTETDYSEEQAKIFTRELGRLELSLKSMNPKAKLRIAMTHYPPISLRLKDSPVSQLLEKYHVNICVFGHLHNILPTASLFGTHHGIQYHLVACDYLDFHPHKIVN